MWRDHPEKVCAFTEEFGTKNPKTVKAVLKALHLASEHLDKLENRPKAAEIIARPAYINCPAPDTGEVRVDGKPLQGVPHDAAIVFQNYSLLPWFSALENVRLAVEAAFPWLGAGPTALSGVPLSRSGGP
jgi:hypothetical protein